MAARGRLLWVFAIVTAGLFCAHPAVAALPGVNGRVFIGNGDGFKLMSVEPDGGDLRESRSLSPARPCRPRTGFAS